MEDKQLNFNQPLLSVRRNTTTTTTQKYESRRTRRSVPAIPRPPPHKSELKSGPIRNPGVVPFLWEQTPGQPKQQEVKPQSENSDHPPIAPKLPPGRNPKPNQQDSSKISPSSSGSKTEAVNLPSESPRAPHQDENVESIKEVLEAKESSDSEDTEEAYVDARDTLSRTESFFLNCSMSGVSGLDDLDCLKPSTDEKTRDLMMDRFLPAAKAMALETKPQYVPKRRQTIVREQPPQQLQKVVVNKSKPLLRYGPSFAKRYSEYHDNGEEGEEEVEESDDEYDHRGNIAAVCGLLPRFCFKGSLCTMNPVPAMSMRTRAQKPPINRIQPRSSSSGSYSETESRFDISEQKSMDKIQRAEHNEDATKLRNVRTSAHDENMQAGANGSKNFEELRVDKGSQKGFDSGGHVVEKTLYVDTFKKLEENEIGINRKDQKLAIDSAIKDFKKSDRVDGEEKFNGDFNFLSSIDKSNEKWGMEMPKALGENQDYKLHSTMTANIEVAAYKEACESLDKHQSSAIIPLNSHQNYSKLPVPPALPKSPSDSWLWRTLPSMPAKNLPQCSVPQNQGCKAPRSDMKWETIVKTTNVQRHHLRSEEMLTPIPET